MRLKNNNHLMYCLNIHPGEDWVDIFSAIEYYSLPIKSRISPNASFALGLRLSAIAARELLPLVKDFYRFLRINNLYVVTINGFPYGPFHGKPIKENVYLPDWSSRERVTYTLDLAMILAAILPEGEIGTISTVPCFYGKEEKPYIISNLLNVAATLNKIKKKTGKHIILALEPEPDCYLDDLDSTLSFFKRIIKIADNTALGHLGVCLDICHAAVEFESPLLWLRKLTDAGIQVPKIQISAALSVILQSPHNSRQLLIPFNDSEYLHQTRVARRGSILKYKDLPDAISSATDGEWRIHFHVPLTWSGGKFFSTVRLIAEDFFKEAYLQGGKHFEVETYSFNVLPEPKPPLKDSIISELEWVIKKLNVLEKK